MILQKMQSRRNLGLVFSIFRIPTKNQNSGSLLPKELEPSLYAENNELILLKAYMYLGISFPELKGKIPSIRNKYKPVEANKIIFRYFKIF